LSNKFLIFILSMTLITSTFAVSTQECFAEDLKDKPSYLKDEVIVKYKSGFRKMLLIDEREKFSLRSKRVLKEDDIELLKIEGSQDVEDVVEELRKNPEVEYVQPNYIYYRRSSMPLDELYPKQWGLDNTGQLVENDYGYQDVDIDAPEAWNAMENLKLDEVVVAIIDDGVDISHPDLEQIIWTNENEIPNNGIDDDVNGYIDDIYGWDFINNDNTVFDSVEEDWHATHLSGIIAAVHNDIGIRGIAPNAKIMSLKIFGLDGATTMQIIEAINYAKMMDIKVSNNSWGGPPQADDYLLNNAIKNSEMLFVAAAGNDGLDNDIYGDSPSGLDAENILSVAAVDKKGNLWENSNYGFTLVDVGAPGEDIWSTITPYIGNDYYACWSGTSMATPFATGIAAVIFGYDKDLTPIEVKKIIMETGVELDDLAGKTVTGKMVNLNNALKALTKQDDIITFTDKNLERIIRKHISKENGDLLQSDVANIKSLDASNSSIESLEGLQYITNLTSIDLNNNELNDIDVLKDLANLTSVKLNKNPLKASVIGVIDTLKEKNIKVDYDIINLDKKSITLDIGKENTGEKLSAVILSNEPVDQNIAWTSSNEKIVKVDDTGKVTGVAEGIASITAKVNEGKEAASCIVFITSDEVFEWKEKVIEEKNKPWTVTFNLKLNRNLVNKEVLYITDEYGEVIDVVLDYSGDKKVVITPKEDYKGLSPYYLFISRDLESESGAKLPKSIRMKFILNTEK